VPQPSSTLADKLARRFQTLEQTRSRIESLVRRGLFSRQAEARMYEALFLSGNVALEGFLEDLFLGLLVSRHGLESGRTDIFPRVEIRSYGIARELIIGPGRRYIDWLPYDRTVALAKLFFRGARPFDDLTDGQRRVLSRCHTIRNVIAHRSRYSLDQFERYVIGSTPLPTSERSPAGYLRGFFRTSPAQTRFSNLLAEALLIAEIWHARLELGRPNRLIS
jgi:hypothetical protein